MTTQAHTTAQAITVRAQDISDWTQAERADIEAEYAVDGAPYGESLRTAWFATEAEARTHAAELIAMTQDTSYDTSWGAQPAWVDGYRITRYVDARAVQAQLVDAHDAYVSIASILASQAPLVTDPETGSVVEGDWEDALMQGAPTEADYAQEYAGAREAHNRSMGRAERLGARFLGWAPIHAAEAVAVSAPASSDSLVSVLHDSIQLASELAPVRAEDGYARPYNSSDATYRRTSNN